MSCGCSASVCTSGQDSRRWTGSKRSALSLPGVAGNLPTGFAEFAAYGDFATGLLATLALLTVRIRPLFWLFVVAFNIVGAADLIGDYYHAIQLDLPAHAGEFGALYAIPILYVPLLMITHFAAFHLLARRPSRQAAEVGLQNAGRPVV
jgi:hypothetical protein